MKLFKLFIPLYGIYNGISQSDKFVNKYILTYFISTFIQALYLVLIILTLTKYES